MPVADILRYNALTWPDRVALVAGDRRITFSELEQAVWRLAGAMSGLCGPGDRVGILAQNVPEYVEALYGVPSAGLVLTLLNYRLNPKEWAWILANAEARAILVEEAYLTDLEPVLADVPTLEHVVVIGDPGDSGHIGYDDLVAGQPAAPAPTAPADSDTAVLIYTSGTTGFPKGAMITHGAIQTAMLVNALEQDVLPFDRFLMSNPMCHASGFSVLHFHVRTSEVVLLKTFSAEGFLSLIEQHRITRATLNPTMARFVLDHPAVDRYDLSSVRSVSYGGMPMPKSTAMELSERFGGLSTNFGQTESTFSVTSLTAADHRRALAGDEYLLASCGRPMAQVAVKILDDQMAEVPVGETGEMCIRSGYTMGGYWRNDEATRDAFAGGWLHTGDLARRDEEGYIYLVDRKKDMIISGGQNVYSTEVERIIGQLPAVAEVAVVGVPDGLWGERVTAVVVRKPGHDLTEQTVIAACRDRLAGYKSPKDVRFWDELPKNVLGKILKRDIRAALFGP
jgi:acyl-CoA synthetase (AMP-forming)/AMP-acid ligase II